MLSLVLYFISAETDLITCCSEFHTKIYDLEEFWSDSFYFSVYFSSVYLHKNKICTIKTNQTKKHNPYTVQGEAETHLNNKENKNNL